jgi:predicted NodU family carbamoyl transferase
MTTVGLGGVERHGSVAPAEGARLLGVCQHERVTRVRNAGFKYSGLPDEALDLPQCQGRSSDDVFEHIVHHLAHACTACFSSPFASATIVKFRLTGQYARL